LDPKGKAGLDGAAGFNGTATSSENGRVEDGLSLCVVIADRESIAGRGSGGPAVGQVARVGEEGDGSRVLIEERDGRRRTRVENGAALVGKAAAVIQEGEQKKVELAGRSREWGVVSE
jgi:hypothetical protein